MRAVQNQRVTQCKLAYFETRKVAIATMHQQRGRKEAQGPVKMKNEQWVICGAPKAGTGQQKESQEKEKKDLELHGGAGQKGG